MLGTSSSESEASNCPVLQTRFLCAGGRQPAGGPPRGPEGGGRAGEEGQGGEGRLAGDERDGGSAGAARLAGEGGSQYQTNLTLTRHLVVCRIGASVTHAVGTRELGELNWKSE